MARSGEVKKIVLALLALAMLFGIGYCVEGDPSDRGGKPYSDEASELLMPMPRSRVNDSAYVLDGAAEQRVEELLKSYEMQTTNQIYVVTVGQSQGYDANQFTTILGNQWGVDLRGKDNGIIIYVRASQMPPWRDTTGGERPYGDYGEGYIATGYGMEGYVTDAQAMRIVRHLMGPHVVAHDYEEALTEAIRALTLLLSGEDITLPTSSPKSHGQEGEGATEYTLTDIGGVVFVLLALSLAGFTVVLTPFVVLGYFFRKNRGESFWRFYFRWWKVVMAFMLSILAQGGGGSGSSGGGGGGGSFGGGGGGGSF